MPPCRLCAGRRRKPCGGWPRMPWNTAVCITDSGWRRMKGCGQRRRGWSGAGRSEIALVKNTSEGIATIAMGLDWRSGDKIVAFREEFPANYYPWKRLEATGVRVEWLSYLDPLDRIDQACRGARLLAISFVQYLSGHRADLEAIGEICHRHR